MLPILYFGFAHLALAAAFAAVALDPRGIAGFFYHARMVAIVHLVTLGWISSSILGSLYVVAPIALRTRIRATWVDYLAFACVSTGTIGMVGHFWIEEYAGMAWSGLTVGAGIMIVGARIMPPLARALVPHAVKGHVVLAFVNVAGAATLGVLVGFDKAFPFLPGYSLAHVFAHAHLAAIGWAAMMVIGMSYRLLPMILPAQMPTGPRLWITAVVIECGVVGLFAALLLRSSTIWIFASLVVGGFAVFLGYLSWMLRRRRPRPHALRTPDPAILHAAAAFTCLVAASLLGMWLATADTTDMTLRVAMGYGVLGLVGFLAQLVVGMEGRLLPLFAWYWAYANAEDKGQVPSPHDMPWHAGQELVFVLWLFGVPALAIGLTFDWIPFVRAAAWSLLAATLLDSVTVAGILRHAFATPGQAASQRATQRTS